MRIGGSGWRWWETGAVQARNIYIFITQKLRRGSKAATRSLLAEWNDRFSGGHWLLLQCWPSILLLFSCR